MKILGLLAALSFAAVVYAQNGTATAPTAPADATATAPAAAAPTAKAHHKHHAKMAKHHAKHHGHMKHKKKAADAAQ